MNTAAEQSVSISKATIQDCHDCAELLLKQLIEHGAEPSKESLKKVLENIVSNDASGFLLLARNGSRTVGVAYLAIILSAEHCGKVGWLEELYVLPEFRSKGIGGVLLTAILERVRKLGIVAIDLEVDAAHRRAESFYRRFGFRPLDRSRWVRVLQLLDDTASA